MANKSSNRQQNSNIWEKHEQIKTAYMKNLRAYYNSGNAHNQSQKISCLPLFYVTV
jgi:hypothetical protein